MMNPFRRNREPSAATRAREKAEQELERTRAETVHIRELALALVQIQEKNHLGATIADIFRGAGER